MESISSILYSLHRDGPTHGKWVVACLEGAWPGILGERLAKACRPRFLRGSTLHVEILDASWGQAIHSLKAQLEERLRSATSGEVKHVRLIPPQA